MKDSHPDNLLRNIPSQLPDGKEHFDEILQRPNVRLERIVSHGQSSPEGFWYDQDKDEWILVLEGEAELRLEEPDELISLQSGDHLLIRSHRRHRVESTTSPTVWLALWVPPA